MRASIAKISRFIVTPEVSKHRIFGWMFHPILPDCKLMVIAKEDDVTFGILHSKIHPKDSHLIYQLTNLITVTPAQLQKPASNLSN